MSNETKSDKKMGPNGCPSNYGNAIGVLMIRLSEQAPVDVVGMGGRNSVTCVPLEKVFNADGKRLGSSLWVANYIPSIQHFRVAHYANEAREPIVRMIHASFVKTWEPIE